MYIRIDGPIVRRIVLPDGSTCDRVIELSGGGEQPVYRVEVLHVVSTPGLPILRAVHEVGDRFVRIGRSCLDCNATPTAVPPDEGFDSAIMVVHAESCPLFFGAVRRYGGAA